MKTQVGHIYHQTEYLLKHSKMDMINHIKGSYEKLSFLFSGLFIA